MSAAALHIRSMAIDGEDVPGHVHGGVLVPPTRANWLVHLTTTRVIPLAVGKACALRIVTREGRTVEGTATVRRSDGQGHYFVGEEIPDDLDGA